MRRTAGGSIRKGEIGPPSQGGALLDRVLLFLRGMQHARAGAFQLAAALLLAAVGCYGEIGGSGPDTSRLPPDAGTVSGVEPVAADARPLPEPEPEPEPEPVDISGPAVRAHVQTFADATCGVVDACTIGTYEGHHPSAQLALDIVVSDALGQYPSDNNALGDAVAEYALETQSESRIWYLIWRQRINYGSGWESMEDRGSITQNHYDHVHISFYD